jgi:hypothetical protein
VLVAVFGKYFALKIDKTSWIAKKELPWIKDLIRRI